MQRRRTSRKYHLPYADRELPVDRWDESEDEDSFEEEEDIYSRPTITRFQPSKTSESEFSWLIYAAATGGAFFLLKNFVG